LQFAVYALGETSNGKDVNDAVIIAANLNTIGALESPAAT